VPLERAPGVVGAHGVIRHQRQPARDRARQGESPGDDPVARPLREFDREPSPAPGRSAPIWRRARAARTRCGRWRIGSRFASASGAETSDGGARSDQPRSWS
jgi:hypothetical protein